MPPRKGRQQTKESHSHKFFGVPNIQRSKKEAMTRTSEGHRLAFKNIECGKSSSAARPSMFMDPKLCVPELLPVCSYRSLSNFNAIIDGISDIFLTFRLETKFLMLVSANLHTCNKGKNNFKHLPL